MKATYHLWDIEQLNLSNHQVNQNKQLNQALNKSVKEKIHVQLRTHTTQMTGSYCRRVLHIT